MKKKKILVQINSVCYGSTGKIMHEIAKEAEKKGFETISFYGRGKGFTDLKSCKINYGLFVYLHGVLTLMFNNHGRYSKFHTKKLIKKLKKINPDIIQLHNIHGYYLNYEIIFDYLKNDYKGKVFWTLHDCWSFTGHCAHFCYINCNKWKKECFKCNQIKEYPKSFFLDTSKNEYLIKKKCFNGVNNLILITPSKWLNNFIDDSFFNYKSFVIYNGINFDIYKSNNNEYIKEKYDIDKNKKLILGVASVWDEKKGLDTFYKLSKDFSNDYQIILVGLSKKQVKQIPKNIIGIERTNNQQELVDLYSAADVFVNPTKQEVLGITSIEAIACGTPVVANNVGGCPEIIDDTNGYLCDSYEEMLSSINKCIDLDFKHTKFNNKSVIRKFDSKKQYLKYIELYNGSDKI